MNTQPKPVTPAPNRAAIINALRAFIAQRSGIEWGNYSSGGNYKESRAAFMGDYRPILKHGRHARLLLSAVEWRESITAQDLIEASERAFMGRLSIKTRDDGDVYIDYCTGQYFPTEYRCAACAVLAAALWNYFRQSMPPAKQNAKGEDRFDGLSGGDYIRRQARREFGRGIAADWFN